VVIFSPFGSFDVQPDTMARVPRTIKPTVKRATNFLAFIIILLLFYASYAGCG
jgi:hypothetical protein